MDVGAELTVWVGCGDGEIAVEFGVGLRAVFARYLDFEIEGV